MMEQAESRLNSFENYSCIIQAHIELPNRPAVVAEGNFYYSKGRYHLDFEEDETICDGEQSMVWYKAFGDVTLKPYEVQNDVSLGGVYQLHKTEFMIVE